MKNEQIRNPKSEIRNKFQISKSKFQTNVKIPRFKCQKAFLFIWLLFMGCASHKTTIRLDPEDEFKRAEANYKKKKYEKAIEGFKRVMFEHPGSEWVESAQFLLAKSYFEKKDYAQSELEYEFFINTYPRSKYAPSASFDLALSYFKQALPYYLDQSLTLKALEKFKEFEQKYPDSKLVDQVKEYERKCINRLARKELETAKLYAKLGKPEAAKLYLESAQSYPENTYSEEINKLFEELKQIKDPASAVEGGSDETQN